MSKIKIFKKMLLKVYRSVLLPIDLNLKISSIPKNFQEKCILLKMWKFNYDVSLTSIMVVRKNKMKVIMGKESHMGNWVGWDEIKSSSVIFYFFLFGVGKVQESRWEKL